MANYACMVELMVYPRLLTLLLFVSVMVVINSGRLRYVWRFGTDAYAPT